MNPKLIKFLTTCGFAIGCTVSGSAYAAFGGTVSDHWSPGSPNSFNGAYGNATIGTTGALNDSFTFNLGAAYAGQYTVSFFGSTQGTVTGLTAYLDNVSFGAGAPNNSGFEFSFSSNTPLSAGAHTLRLAGNVDPLSYASTYYGSYNVQVLAAPVPEPETFAMLLAGLGLIGAATRRRSNKVDAT